jgi:hypothetical protein
MTEATESSWPAPGNGRKRFRHGIEALEQGGPVADFIAPDVIKPSMECSKSV